MAALSGGLFAAVALPGRTADAVGQTVAWHIHLVRSDPANGDTLRASPPAVRLWFSQAPELAVTTIHLTTAAGAAMALAPLTRDTAAAAPVTASLKGQAGPGAYVISWRTTARDGHPASGRIHFVVAAAGAPRGN